MWRGPLARLAVSSHLNDSRDGMGATSKAHPWHRSLTARSLLALLLGLLGGMVAALYLPAPEGLTVALESLTRAWTNALRLIVVPLVVSQLFLAIASGRTSKTEVGRLGVFTPLVFFGLLTCGAVFTLLTVPRLLALPGLHTLSMPALGLRRSAEAGVIEASAVGARWVDGFIPPNLFAAATGDNILPLMIFSGVFALAVKRGAPELQRTLILLFRAVSDAIFIIVEWLVRATPVVVFALAFRAAVGSGLEVGSVLLAFTIVEAVLLVVFWLALYPLTAAIGRVSLRAFARALIPAQLAAATTRSSLATLPALLQAADTVLAIPPAFTAYVVPLAGATLKLSRAISSPCKLLFLAHVLGLNLTPLQLAVFTLTILLISPATPGIPRVTSGMNSLPAYVAAGIPAEYVVLLGVATGLTDIFMTVLNTTGYMSANVIVARFAASGLRRAADMHDASAPTEGDPAAISVASP